jgi:hypothetical protein
MFRIVTILLASCSFVLGFDPAGPPRKKTLSETCSYLSKVVIPTVDFSQATLEETVGFFELDKPKEYRLSYQIDDAFRDSGRRFTMKAKDVTYIVLIAAVAEQMDADILLSAGQVTFAVRKIDRKHQ